MQCLRGMMLDRMCCIMRGSKGRLVLSNHWMKCHINMSLLHSTRSGMPAIWWSASNPNTWQCKSRHCDGTMAALTRHYKCMWCSGSAAAVVQRWCSGATVSVSDKSFTVAILKAEYKSEFGQTSSLACGRWTLLISRLLIELCCTIGTRELKHTIRWCLFYVSLCLRFHSATWKKPEHMLQSSFQRIYASQDAYSTGVCDEITWR